MERCNLYVENIFLKLLNFAITDKNTYIEHCKIIFQNSIDEKYNNKDEYYEYFLQ